MADNTTLNVGSGGDVLRTDDIAGVKVPVSKIMLGGDGLDLGFVSGTNPLPVQDMSGSVVGLLVGGVALGLGNPAPVTGALGLLVGGLPVSLANPAPVTGAIGLLVAGTQASVANPLPTRPQSGSLTAILIGGNAVPVSFSNPFPVSGGLGLQVGGAPVGLANPLAVQTALEGGGQILSGTTTQVVQFFATDVATSGSTQIIPPQAGQGKIRVLALNVMSNGTVLAKWQSTGSVGSIQNLSGYIPMVVNGGYTLPHNPHGWFQTRANEGLNLALSAAVNCGITLTWMVA